MVRGSGITKDTTTQPNHMTPEHQLSKEDLDRWIDIFRFKITGTKEEQKQLRQLAKECVRFIDDIRTGQKPRWLVLLGPSGCGKTFLARTIWDWYKQSPHWKEQFTDGLNPGRFCDWPDVAWHLQQNEWTGMLDDIAQERVVVIDEIGADRDKNGHVRDCLARLCSKRVGKWTVVTSNRSLQEIGAQVDERVSSRMQRDGSVVVELNVRDYFVRK